MKEALIIRWLLFRLRLTQRRERLDIRLAGLVPQRIRKWVIIRAAARVQNEKGGIPVNMITYELMVDRA